MRKDWIKKIVNQRVTIFFIVISGLLWYLNRLNRRFTTEIPVDIEIIDDYNSKVWIENRELTYTINCEADGRLLTIAKMGLLPQIKVYSSTLRYIPRDGYVNVIEPNSLKHAIQQKFNNVNVNYIIDSLNEVVVSPLVERNLPLKGNIEIYCKRQYMIVGQIDFSFDSVLIKAPKIILDTMQYIATERYEKKEAKSTIRSSVDLILPKNILAQKDEVSFTAQIAQYTEIVVDLPINVKNLPYGNHATVVPSHTKVGARVPLYSFSKEIELKASIDLSQKRSSTLFEVAIDSLPNGAKLIFVEPQFVEPFLN